MTHFYDYPLLYRMVINKKLARTNIYWQLGTFSTVSHLSVSELKDKPSSHSPILRLPSERHIIKKRHLPWYGCLEWSPKGRTSETGHLKNWHSPLPKIKKMNQYCFM